MVKPRPNGYSLGVKLCEHFSSNGTGLSFPTLCKVFGPVYWEKLDPLQKLYFKRLALHYKTTETGAAERNGTRPSNAQVALALYTVNTILSKIDRVVKKCHIVPCDHSDYVNSCSGADWVPAHLC